MLRGLIGGLCAGLLLLLTPLPAAGQGAGIRLRVLDDSTGAAIPRAEILLDSARRLATDSAGFVHLTALSPGEHLIKAGRTGYRPQQLVVRVGFRDVEVEIALRPMAVRLPEVIASAKRLQTVLRMVRFYDRQMRGGGVAWDWEAIDAVSRGGGLETLIPRIPGFGVRAAGADTAWVVFSTRGPGVPEVCPVPVLVDGQLAGPLRLASLTPDHLAGLEAYPGPATAPAELAALAGGARCGLIALWTYAGP